MKSLAAVPRLATNVYVETTLGLVGGGSTANELGTDGGIDFVVTAWAWCAWLEGDGALET